jgi:predicted permease
VTGVVLAFDLGVSLLVGMIFGLLPALHATRVEPGDALRSAAPVAPRGLRARGALIVSQMALAMVLVTGAVLVINSFARLLATSVGARSDRLLTFRVDLPRTRYGGERTRTFYDQLVARLDAMPGIDAAAVANALPVSGQMEATVAAPAPEEERDPIGVHMVSARWFEVFGVPLRDGRLPTVAEHATAAAVAVLNETAARVFFPAGNAVGSRLRLATGVVREVEVVGIVGDVKYEAIEQPVGPDVYISSMLYATESNYVILRTSSTETTLLEPVRRQVQALDPQLALYDVRTMRDRVAGAVSRTRFSALLLGTFATLALALAAVGVYGVVSHQARARTREIAIRMAVGAGAGRVLRGVLADGLVLAVVAVLIGVPAALAATRAVRGLLYGVTPQEPVVLATVAATIVGVALIASWLPARRAARTDPMTVLRHE